MSELKPCPCGEVPEKLSLIEGPCSKWAYASGSCCGDWSVEFRTNYMKLDDYEAMKEAMGEWNRVNRNNERTELDELIRKIDKVALHNVPTFTFVSTGQMGLVYIVSEIQTILASYRNKGGE